MRTRRFIFIGLAGATAVRNLIAAAAGGAEPEAFISLRGVKDETMELGEPLFVGVRFEAPFESKIPMSLAPASGTWADGVEVVFLRGDAVLPPRATATFKPTSASATLDADHPASGEWFFPAAQTSQLAAGDYTVQVRLSVRGGRGWTGTTASQPVKIHVVATANTPARVLQRTIALANEALDTDHLQEAARLVDTLLTDQPDNLRLLTIRARICARAGDLRGAMTCVTRAMSTEEVEKLAHPPIGLFEMQDEIGEAMLSAAARNESPPEWTKLPPRVSELIRPSKPVAQIPVSSAAPAVIAVTPTKSVIPTPIAAGSVATRPATPAPGKSTVGAPSKGAVIPAAELDEAKILADRNGQWAVSAAAGSQYSSPNYSAAKMTGPPDVPAPGDNVNAWCHGSSSATTDWVELTFAQPTPAVELRVRQTNCPGAIARVEAFEPDGTAHLWWEGADPAKAPSPASLAWFAVRVPRTDYSVAKIKLTLNLAAVPGWKQIDAVQLVGVAH